MAEPTGLEPATSDVTGRRSNQLNYDSAKFSMPFVIRHLSEISLRSEICDLRSNLVGTEGLEPPTSSL
jgi:hypothetical protein